MNVGGRTVSKLWNNEARQSLLCYACLIYYQGDDSSWMGISIMLITHFERPHDISL